VLKHYFALSITLLVATSLSCTSLFNIYFIMMSFKVLALALLSCTVSAATPKVCILFLFGASQIES